MKENRLRLAILVLTLTILLPTTATANGGKGRRQGPPPEAIEACEGKSAGDSVEFTGRRGKTLQATCQEIEGQLAAVPENMGKRGARPN